jgi:hypothetical protein
MNKWGMAAILALIAVLPVAALSRYVGESGTAADVPPFAPLLLAVLCSVAAARRGSRWWLVVTLLAALWGFVVLLQLTIGE